MTGLALTQLFWYHAFQDSQTNCLQKSEGFQFTPQVASGIRYGTYHIIHHGFASAWPKSIATEFSFCAKWCLSLLFFGQVWYSVIFFAVLTTRKSARLCLWCFLRGHPICLSYAQRVLTHSTAVNSTQGKDGKGAENMTKKLEMTDSIKQKQHLPKETCIYIYIIIYIYIDSS